MRGACRLDGVALNPAEGLLSVWVRPHWRGDDGRRVRLWATAESSGRRLELSKAANGLLRAEVTTPHGRTVARADVSRWMPGEWHHVGVGWISHRGRNVGLALWVDRVCEDGPVTPHGVWDQAATPATIELGDPSAVTDFDELIVRPDLSAEGGHGMIACVYRDYFRSAPYDAVRVDRAPTRVPSDARAVAGLEKVFGLQARRQGRWEPVTEQVVRYSQWAYFDAKPLIRWSVSDARVATIDAAGRLKTLRPGRCLVRAEFHGLPPPVGEIGLVRRSQVVPARQGEAVGRRGGRIAFESRLSCVFDAARDAGKHEPPNRPKLEPRDPFAQVWLRGTNGGNDPHVIHGVAPALYQRSVELPPSFGLRVRNVEGSFASPRVRTAQQDGVHQIVHVDVVADSVPAVDEVRPALPEIPTEALGPLGARPIDDARP